jgi:hypothetical protein
VFEKKAQQDADGVVNSVLINGTNPDEAAKVHDLSQRSGVPPAVARNMPEQVKRRMRRLEIRKKLEESPSLAKSFSDPSVAEVAHDDVENLSLFESLLRYGKNALIRGGVRVKQGANQMTAGESEKRSIEAKQTFGQILDDEVKDRSGYIPNPVDIISAGAKYTPFGMSVKRPRKCRRRRCLQQQHRS